MSWRYETARRRIDKLIEDAPAIEVQRFSDQYLPQYEARRRDLAQAKEPISPPLFDLSEGRAVQGDTVQVYMSIVDYEAQRLDEDRETEASHERGFRLLHLYYSACDRVIEQTGLQRVDYHGSRMHAVLMDRSGQGVTAESLAEAFAFVRDFQSVIDQANRELANSQFSTRIRVGIDVGPCVAINNGTGHEKEPLFLGSAANHAAKLAEGVTPGIYLSDRARALLGMPPRGLGQGFDPFDDSLFRSHAARYDERTIAASEQRFAPESLVEDWRREITSRQVPDPTVPRFVFHFKEPPLSSIDYAQLMPSNSIRMPLASVFADLSGYTAYIDHAIATGSIPDAVRALYVIRAEFQNVVEDDFGGRKVRFIGDCIHAVLAEGDSQETDDVGTVSETVACTGGLRSSFELCQDRLGGLEALGLAIGIEFGDTPISRVGIRGERSVRIASSVATTVSEAMQQESGKSATKLGPNAFRLLPAALRDLVDDRGVAEDATYDDISSSLSNRPASAIAPAYVRAHNAPDRATPRAHFGEK